MRLVSHGGCDQSNRFVFRPRQQFAALIVWGFHIGLNWGPMWRITSARQKKGI